MDYGHICVFYKGGFVVQGHCPETPAGELKGVSYKELEEERCFWNQCLRVHFLKKGERVGLAVCKVHLSKVKNLPRIPDSKRQFNSINC